MPRIDVIAKFQLDNVYGYKIPSVIPSGYFFSLQ